MDFTPKIRIETMGLFFIFLSGCIRDQTDGSLFFHTPDTGGQVKAHCPRCRFAYDFREAVKDQVLMEIILLQADFGHHAKLVLEYAGLFDSTRPINTLKLRRILGEIKDLYTSGRFVLNRATYEISKNGISEALKIVCNKRFTAPLANHNYLKTVMVSIAEKEAGERSIQKEKELRRKEDALRAGARRDGPVKSKEDTDSGSPARVGDLAKDALPWKRG
jgi:hypothetical protein